MNEKEILELVIKELEAIYEDLDINVNQLVLLRDFLKNLLSGTKNTKLSYSLNEIREKINAQSISAQ